MLLSNGSLAPVAFADETPSVANRIYFPRTGMPLVGVQAAYGAIYRTQPWVSALVNKLAYGTARLPLKVYRRGPAGRQDARDAPLGQLLRNPNRRHDPFFFWLWTASTFEVYGEALWVKNRPTPGSPPQELWPLHPSNVFTRRSEGEILNGRQVAKGDLVYAYHFGSAQAPVLEWGSEDVVHFRSYNPEDQVRGLSRLEPLRSTLLAEDAARRATTAMYSNGARPSVLLSTDRTMSDQALNRLKASWDAAHAGVDSWGKTALLEEGIKPTVVQLNAEEMQYIEARRLNREEACGVYDVPPPVVHILDRATFSNITEQMRSMYRDTMAPRLGLYESVIDTQLRPDFDPKGDLYAEFLMDEVLRGAFETRATAYQQAVNSGWLMPAEVRELENLPFVTGSDKLLVNSAIIPLGTSTEAPPVGTDTTVVPQRVKTIDGSVVCGACSGDGPLSARGLCRPCEGKQSRAAAAMKELI